MELKSLTPVEFLKRTGGNEDNFATFLERGTYLQRMQIETRYTDFAEEKRRKKKLPLLFERGMAVYDRIAYGELCQEYDRDNCAQPIDYPLVDKKSNLVFELGEGAHSHMMIDLYNLYEGTNHGAVPDLIGEHRIRSMYGTPGLSSRFDPAREFIVKGYGYVISSVSWQLTDNRRPAFAISRRIFETDALDEYDEAILKNYQIKIAEDFFV